MRSALSNLVLCCTLLSTEPFALVHGPLHLHEGHATPHRDHDSEEESSVVAVPTLARPVLSQEESIFPVLAFVCHGCPGWEPMAAGGQQPVSRGPRSPPSICAAIALPLLI